MTRNCFANPVVVVFRFTRFALPPRRLKIVLPFLFSCFAVLASGQQRFLQHFTVDNGLPSNELYQVLQDTTGSLLIATDRGAVRYDGYSFSDVPLGSNLTNKPVYYIYESPNREIYFSSLQGKIYHYRNDTLFDSPLNDKTSKLFNHPGILIANSISMQADTSWISFNNDFDYNYKVGSCYVTDDGAVQKINQPNGIYFDLRRHFLYRQLSFSSLAVSTQPVFITWPDGEVTRDEVTLSWPAGYIRRLFHKRCGDYELFSIGRKLFVYKNRKKVSSHIFPGNVLNLTICNYNRFYVGFENKGASVYRLQEGTVSGPEDELLQGFSVTCIYNDNQNGVWFSTLENGLFYHHPSKARFRENHTKIVALAKNRNRVFAGYQSGQIDIYTDGQPVETLQVPLAPESSLLRFSFTHTDSLIAITDRGYFVRQQNKWQLQPGGDILLLSVGPNLLYGASAATAELHVYKGLGGKLIEKKQLSKRIISMYADSTKKVWIGTWEGLLKYDNKELTDYGKEHPAFKDRIVSIGELPGGYLVVATLGSGLVVYKDNRTYALNATNGLGTAIINAMVVDNGRIWIGTNKGLAMVRFEQNRFRVTKLGLEAGLPSLDVHQFTVADGWLYIKWVNRLVALHGEEFLLNKQNTTTTITSVFVNDKDRSYVANSPLNYSQNTLTFYFTAVNLSSAKQQAYSYTLEGFDRSWHRTTERYVKYTNLPPGKYQFLVQAINLRDNTRSPAAAYSFVIKPAFWQQWWFPFFVVGLIVLLLAFIFQFRLNAVKEKNNLLLDLAENRQKVLVQLIHPHFMFNVLNTIQGAVLKQDKIVAASLIAKFAKLMRLSMELSKEKWVNLEKEVDLLTRYFELEEIRSPGRFTYLIEVLPPLPPAQVIIPSMLIQPFVENAIKHGIMHLADRKGSIIIQVRKEKEALICTVDDNGIGRQHAERINKAHREGHESSGIDITVNRLRLVHREQGTTFLYKIVDKEDAGGKPAGTTIIFSIPFTIKHDKD